MSSRRGTKRGEPAPDRGRLDGLWPLALAGTAGALGGLLLLWGRGTARSMSDAHRAAWTLVALVVLDASLSHLWWRFGGGREAAPERLEEEIDLTRRRRMRFAAGLLAGGLVTAGIVSRLPLEKWWTASRYAYSFTLRCTNPNDRELSERLVYLPIPFERWKAEGLFGSEGRDLRLFTPSGRQLPWNLAWMVSRRPLPEWHLVFPLTAAPRQQVDLALYTGRRHARLPEVATPAPPASDPMEDSTGLLIAHWSRRRIPLPPGPFGEDPFMTAPFGRSVVEVVVDPEDRPGDHGTNQAILYREYYETFIDGADYLEYDMRAAQESTLRASAALRVGGRYRWDYNAPDALGRSAAWSTDLNDLYVDQWYHRRIPLADLAGEQLEQSFLMTNDEPELREYGPVTFYFDNIDIVRGDPPICHVLGMNAADDR